MGNCMFRWFDDGVVEDMMVKVVTSNGGIMELYAPITVECITNEFPGHGIFRTRRERDLLDDVVPLLHNEELHAGEVYYLLPLNHSGLSNGSTATINRQFDDDGPSMATSKASSYRMSTCDSMCCYSKQGLKLKKWSEPEMVRRYNSSGVWKVKLVISPEQLSEILSQESRTEALIESVRTVAKCRNGATSSVATEEQLSVSSSWKDSTFDRTTGSDT